MCTADAFRVTWSEKVFEGVSRPFVSNKSPKCNHREGLESRRTGTRQALIDSVSLICRVHFHCFIVPNSVRNTFLFYYLKVITTKPISVAVAIQRHFASIVGVLRNRLSSIFTVPTNRQMLRHLEHFLNNLL